MRPRPEGPRLYYPSRWERPQPREPGWWRLRPLEDKLIDIPLPLVPGERPAVGVGVPCEEGRHAFALATECCSTCLWTREMVADGWVGK